MNNDNKNETNEAMKDQRLGIRTTYKGEEIGFTPITQDNRLADANYFLYDELGRKEYNRFEEALHTDLMEGNTEGSFKDIAWEVVTEEEYNG